MTIALSVMFVIWILCCIYLSLKFANGLSWIIDQIALKQNLTVWRILGFYGYLCPFTLATYLADTNSILCYETKDVWMFALQAGAGHK